MNWLPIGTKVAWESVRRGYQVTKTGVIRAHLPRGQTLAQVQQIQQATGAPRIQRSSRHDRYLVEESRSHARNGGPIASGWYVPIKQTIDQQNNGNH